MLDLVFNVLRVAFRVEDGNLGRIVRQQGLDDLDRRRLASIAGVLLERISQDRDLLTDEGAVQISHDSLDEAVALVLVDGEDLCPVLGHLIEVKRLSEIDKGEDIFLEAGAAEAEPSFQEFWAQTHIKANGLGELINIGTGLLANRTNAVDRANPLRKHGICHEFRKLRGPEVDRDDFRAIDPRSIDVFESGCCCEPGFRLRTPDQDTIRVEEIFNCSPFCKELWIREDLERDSWSVDFKL